MFSFWGMDVGAGFACVVHGKLLGDNRCKFPIQVVRLPLALLIWALNYWHDGVLLNEALIKK